MEHTNCFEKMHICYCHIEALAVAVVAAADSPNDDCSAAAAAANYSSCLNTDDVDGSARVHDEC